MTMDTTPGWQDLLESPEGTPHLVQIYQDEDFFAEAVSEYAGGALRAGEAALLIATPRHRKRIVRELHERGLAPEAALQSGQLRLLDAAETLAPLMRDGMPDWQTFREAMGGLIAELRLQYPRVRAYGEMVDVLWQEGLQEAALRLEEFWHELAAQQTFSLLCSYRIDNLDAASYGGGLECVCDAHTHVIPARDYVRFNDAVRDASQAVLDHPLAQMLMSLSALHRPRAQMPLGQATLFWLKKNMPRTADKVLSEVRSQLAQSS